MAPEEFFTNEKTEMAKKASTRRVSNPVYGFNVTGGSPHFSSEAAWEAQMTEEGAKAYITGQLRTQLAREVPVALVAFEAANKTGPHEAGFYAVARMLFPVVSFLGCLYRGHDNTETSVAFIEDFADPKYRNLAPAIFIMYRHGLVHTAMPKIIERTDGKMVGWEIELNDSAIHLTTRTKTKGWSIVVSLRHFYQDMLEAIDKYVQAFDGPNKATLLANFKKGYLEMARIERFDAPQFGKMSLKLQQSVDSIK
jgi:hypothetical protein